MSIFSNTQLERWVAVPVFQISFLNQKCTGAIDLTPKRTSELRDNIITYNVNATGLTSRLGSRVVKPHHNYNET